LIHGLYILSDKKTARETFFMWSNKMWIHCSKCLGSFHHATDFWRIGKCYVSYKFVHIANISTTRMDEWNTKSLKTFKRWSEIFEFARSECILLKNTTYFGILFYYSRYYCSYKDSIFYHKCSVDWPKEPFPCWNHQSSDSNKNRFWGTFVQRLLYFDSKQSQITSTNSFIYEVQDICPRGQNSSFNINWKLTSNKTV
jgi:hypothetical protein